MGDISRLITDLFAQATGALSVTFEDNGSKRHPLAPTPEDRAIQAVQQARECFKKIAALQAKCRHHWFFNRQESTGDGRLWDVAYKCLECNLERRERKQPVCEKCDATLKQASTVDPAVEAMRLQAQSDEFKTPIIFKCSACGELHVLFYEMD